RRVAPSPISHELVRVASSEEQTMKHLFPAFCVVAFLSLPSARAHAAAQLFPPIQNGTISATLVPVATNLTAPLDARSGPDNDNRLFVTDQAGKVQVFLNKTLQGTFIDVSSRLVPLQAGYDERGFLGFALEP